METPTLFEFSFTNEQHRSAATAIWNAACGSDYVITPRFVEYNTRPSTGSERAGMLAMQAGQPVGFVIASAEFRTPEHEGWVDAVAVNPSHQRLGIGRALLNWADNWLLERGCPSVNLGSSLRPFAPGLPVPLSPEPFLKMGYQQTDENWDVARTLQGFTSCYPNPVPSAELRPMQPGQENELLTFLEREFPGGWHFGAQEFVREKLRLSDWLLLWIEDRLQGFCCITLEDSDTPIDRYYLQRLPHPWGQVGTYGVANALRGRGYGLYLIDASLIYLRDRGVNGCVIDWTSFLDLYDKFGFKPYTRYLMMQKDLK